MSRRKAVVAMSGGVDSSVAAALMVQAGYDVTGIMLKLWSGEAANNDSGCCNVGAAEDARRVADALSIPFYVFNFAEQFEESVVRDFNESYRQGRTPNPCVRCNQWIKFGALLERARAIGADVLATGHYARVTDSKGEHRLLRGVDRNKDQSYVLWMLSQDELASARFPVGELHKTETRAIAESLGLRTAHKPESQEICFVSSGDFGSYVERELSDVAEPGPIVDTSGEVLGQHRGIGRYTIGQRRGLGIAVGSPIFVNQIDKKTNTIVVGERAELAVTGAKLDEVSFAGTPPPDGARVRVQHRAHGEVFPARVRYTDGGMEVVFDRPVEAVAPGQSAVLYDDHDPDRLLGGGIVASTTAAALITR